MKKRFVSALLAVMMMGIAVPAAAAPSISQIIPEQPKVIGGAVSGKQELVVQNADTKAYKDKKVAEVVNKANDENTIITVMEIVKELGVDTSAPIVTTGKKKEKVNPALLEQVTPFVDLVIKEGEKVTYTSEGDIRASLTIEAVKDMKKQDIMLMQIDPNDGKVYFIPVEELDKKTGEVTATFPTLGAVAVLKKVPIVVKDTSPEKYKNEKAKETVAEFKEKKADIDLSAVLVKLEDKEEAEEISLADGITVKAENYTSAMGFADLAIKQGEDYLYDMEGELEAKASRSLEDTDWQRMVSAGYADFDIAAAEADPALLTELNPFVIDESFIMQINPVTGKAEYIYEPELSFEMPEAEEEETEEAEEEETEETEAVAWKVFDESKEDTDMPYLVIHAEYKSMGPFAIFLPKAE